MSKVITEDYFFYLMNQITFLVILISPADKTEIRRLIAELHESFPRDDNGHSEIEQFILEDFGKLSGETTKQLYKRLTETL
jgi:hypothetical protein